MKIIRFALRRPELNVGSAQTPLFARFIYGLAIAFVFATVLATFGHAQVDSTGTTAVASSSVTGSGLATTSSDVANAFNTVNGQVKSLSGTLIGAAVTLSSRLDQESDKFAGALAVIVIVFTFIEFAGTRHPVAAWVRVFQNLFVLGIFATVYAGYGTAAPGFYTWFATLASDLNGTANPVQALGNAIGAVWMGIVHSGDGAHVSDLLSIVAVDILALICMLLIAFAGLVYLYYSLVGMVQSGIGIVFGKIAIALGFHQMTRSFFSSWLAFMIHAGMYVAVAGAMNALVIQQFVGPLQATGNLPATMAFATVLNATFASLFILLMSLEIPKIAGMFGSGGASGGLSPLVVGAAVTDALLGKKPEEDKKDDSAEEKKDGDPGDKGAA
jgi:hypothetical protein